MFKRTLYLECRKAIRNRLFVIAIAVGCIVTLCSLIPQVKSYYRGIQVVNGFSEVFQHRNPHAAMNTLYNHWVGGETHTLGSSVYFFIFPLLVAIPYGWSFCNEHRIGYTRCMVLKTGKFPYYFAKYCAVFLSGGLTMVIPLVFNFLLSHVCSRSMPGSFLSHLVCRKWGLPYVGTVLHISGGLCAALFSY